MYMKSKEANTATRYQSGANAPRSLEFSQALLDRFTAFCHTRIGYHFKNTSECVLYALLAYSGNKINVAQTRKRHILLIPDPAERLNVLPASVRIPDALYADLRKTAKNLHPPVQKTEAESHLPMQETAPEPHLTVQETATMIMLHLLNRKDLPRHALRITGSKRDKRMQDAIATILKNRHYDASVEPCGGALEIHQNFKVADTEIVCDIDPDKINCYRVIQTHHQTFVSRAMSYPINHSTFMLLRESTPLNAVDKAVKFFYLALNSSLNDLSTYKKITLRGYWNAIAATYALHARLQNTQIYLRDIFKTLESRNLPDGRTLLIVDPPYLETKVYRDNLTRDDHQKLAKRLLYLHQKNKHDFVYFCRITAGHDNKKDANKQAKKVQNDLLMKGQIDNLYYSHGLFFTDISLNDGVVERIITSFPFEGATLYGKEVR